MPIILAHRGNADGPSPTLENHPLTVQAALAAGWGVEIDIRRAADGRFYISHDRRRSADGCVADAYCALFRQYPDATVALNVKETGYERALLTYLESQGVLDQLFLFDMELIETRPGTTARLYRQFHPDVQLAARVSDRGEPVARALEIPEASIAWVDEFDRLWCQKSDIEELKDAGRTVFAVSPELHHFPPDRAQERWVELIEWGVDGICTDYPAALERLLRGMGHEVAA